MFWAVGLIFHKPTGPWTARGESPHREQHSRLQGNHTDNSPHLANSPAVLSATAEFTQVSAGLCAYLPVHLKV